MGRLGGSGLGGRMELTTVAMPLDGGKGNGVGDGGKLPITAMPSSMAALHRIPRSAPQLRRLRVYKRATAERPFPGSGTTRGAV